MNDTFLGLLVLDKRSGQPIYRQIVEQLQGTITSGSMASGQRLPSVRTVAKRLAVNPMTVSKAYSVLENSGAVLRRPGIGMIVTRRTVSPSDGLRHDIKAVIERARALDVDLEELNALITMGWRA